MGNAVKQGDVFDKTYRVAEIFHSIQGEGYWMGMPATFIRLQGCPVRCSWCDSESTWGKGGSVLRVRDILKVVSNRNVHIVITGGEPMIQNLDALIMSLQQKGFYVQIETSGYQWYTGNHRAQWLTVSPKPPLFFKVPVEYYRYANEFKWVIDDEISWDTLWTSWKYVMLERDRTTDRPIFSLMPEGCPPTEKTVGKTLSFLQCVPQKLKRNWMFTDRIQWRIGVR